MFVCVREICKNMTRRLICPIVTRQKKLILNKILQLFTRFSLDFVRCWCNCGSLKMRDCVGVSGARVVKMYIWLCVSVYFTRFRICWFVCVSVLFVKIVLDKIKPMRRKIHTIDGFDYSCFTVILIIFAAFYAIGFLLTFCLCFTLI